MLYFFHQSNVINVKNYLNIKFLNNESCSLPLKLCEFDNTNYRRKKNLFLMEDNHIYILGNSGICMVTSEVMEVDLVHYEPLSENQLT